MKSFFKKRFPPSSASMIGEQIAYYHAGYQDLEDITIQVSLWQVQTPKDDPGFDSCITADTYKLTLSVKWQEKIDSPLESAKQAKQSLSDFDTSISCDPFSRISEIGMGKFIKCIISFLPCIKHQTHASRRP